MDKFTPLPAIVITDEDGPVVIWPEEDRIPAEAFLDALGIGARWEEARPAWPGALLAPTINARIVRASQAGKSKSPKKLAAVAKNARLGGRPRRRVYSLEEGLSIAKQRGQALSAILHETGLLVRFWPSGKHVTMGRPNKKRAKK